MSKKMSLDLFQLFSNCPTNIGSISSKTAFYFQFIFYLSCVLRTGNLICVLPNSPLIYYPDTLHLQVSWRLEANMGNLQPSITAGTSGLPSLQGCRDIRSQDGQPNPAVAHPDNSGLRLYLYLPHSSQ